jgi:hypothetical protein
VGLDANYPAVTIKNETDSVPIYNEQHLPVGVLSVGTSRSTNVTCIAQKTGGDWDDEWYYRQMNPAANPVPTDVGWIPADRVNVLHNPHDPDPIPTCVDLSGCLKNTAVGSAKAGAAVAGVVGVAAGVGPGPPRRGGAGGAGPAPPPPGPGPTR